MGRSVRVAPVVALVAVVGVLAFVVLAELLAAPAPEADGAPDDDPATADTGATGATVDGVPAPLRSRRLLTALEAAAGPDGVLLTWEVDEALAESVTAFTCVYRTPAHLRLGVSGAVPCSPLRSPPDARSRTVAGLPEYGDYDFEVVAEVAGEPAIPWPERALRVRVAVTEDLAGPPGAGRAVTGEGPLVEGCGPGDGVGDASEGRPWRRAEIVSAAHLTHYPGRGWSAGGDPAAAPEWPEPPSLADLFDEAGLDGDTVREALDAGGDPEDRQAAAAQIADDRSLPALARAAAGTKALLRPGPEGWELRLHTSYPFGADYVYRAEHAVAGWDDPAHPALGPALWQREGCPPRDNPDATHDVALALSDAAAGDRRLAHSGYGWWAVAPVGMFPERIVATKGGLSFGDPAPGLPEAGTRWSGRVAGHLFWDQRRFALAADLALTLDRIDGEPLLEGRITDVMLVPLDPDSLEPLEGPTLRWRSLGLQGAPIGEDGAWSGLLQVGPEPEDAPTEMPAGAAFRGDWRAAAYGPDAGEIAGRLRLWTPLPEGADPNTDWPRQVVLVAGFGGSIR